MSISSPFDIVKNINCKAGLINNDEIMAAYNAYIIDKVFGSTLDTLFIANEANTLTNLPKPVEHEMRYRFYYHTVERNPDRYAKWIKPKNAEEIEEKITILTEYYKFSRAKAAEVIDIITDKQYDIMKSKLFKGGTQNAKTEERNHRNH